jgi:hypothetical protein
VEIDLKTKQQLANLLAKPAMVTEAHAPLLDKLVKIYPYYQPLHLLLAKATLNVAHHNHLATAALYNGGALLHQVVYSPESLLANPVDLVANNYIQVDDKSTDEQEIFEEIAEVNTDSTSSTSTDEETIYDEIVEVDSRYVHQEKVETEEEETFEEINEVTNATFEKDEATSLPEQEETYDEIAEIDAIPDELAIESIVTTDFFAFEKNFQSDQPTENQKNFVQNVIQPEEYDQEAEEQTVSKYDDDKLPYTFLWWLAKTRKEHEQIFQPYVTSKKTNENPGELHQQYVEHIFHLQTPFNVAEEAEKDSLNKQIAHRGDEIIDTFIKNEPQIRAPKIEQINNENKAKKSAEDHNDLVSETLAAIYIEQMLYHKAIDTYEKLSLKFPEKSRYFADLIQSLEKKI